MKQYFLILFLLGLVHRSTQSAQCTAPMPENIKNLNWQDMLLDCHQKISSQVQHELTASITYLAMSAHFNRELYHRPGMAKFFLESAIEERGHAKQMIEYLLLRGGELSNDILTDIIPVKTEWDSASSALTDALKLEKKVTEDIKAIIKVCEGTANNDTNTGNDYHAVDYFTGEFLNEQHTSLRQLSGFLATLERMKIQYGSLAEIIFDQTFE